MVTKCAKMKKNERNLLVDHVVPLELSIIKRFATVKSTTTTGLCNFLNSCHIKTIVGRFPKRIIDYMFFTQFSKLI